MRWFYILIYVIKKVKNNILFQTITKILNKQIINKLFPIIYKVLYNSIKIHLNLILMIKKMMKIQKMMTQAQIFKNINFKENRVNRLYINIENNKTIVQLND